MKDAIDGNLIRYIEGNIRLTAKEFKALRPKVLALHKDNILSPADYTYLLGKILNNSDSWSQDWAIGFITPYIGGILDHITKLVSRSRLTDYQVLYLTEIVEISDNLSEEDRKKFLNSILRNDLYSVIHKTAMEWLSYHRTKLNKTT